MKRRWGWGSFCVFETVFVFFGCFLGIWDLVFDCGLFLFLLGSFLGF